MQLEHNQSGAPLSSLFGDTPDMLARWRRQQEMKPQLERRQKQLPPYITHRHLPVSERILMYKRPLNPEQVALEVDVDRNTIYRWVRAGTLPVRRAGRFLKFDQGPLVKWVKQREFIPLDQWEVAVG
jgi:hypothetical protein